MLIVTHLFTVFQEGTALLYCYIDRYRQGNLVYFSRFVHTYIYILEYKLTLSNVASGPGSEALGIGSEVSGIGSEAWKHINRHIFDKVYSGMANE